MGRRWLMIAAGVVTATAAVVLLVLRPWASDRSQAHPASVAHPALTAARGQTIAADLAAGTPAALADAVLVPAGQALDPTALPGLAALHLTVDASSFALSPDAPDLATVSVTSGAGAAARSWRATLVFTAGEWKIAASESAR